MAARKKFVASGNPLREEPGCDYVRSRLSAMTPLVPARVRRFGQSVEQRVAGFRGFAAWSNASAAARE